MAEAADSSTSETLLRRLRRDPTDKEAWTLFVERYGPRIARWTRRHGLQDADVQDITQDVILKLYKRLQNFQYDPRRSFRGFLRSVTQSVVADFFTELAKTVRACGGDAAYSRLLSLEARAELEEELAGLIDVEVWEEAQHMVQLRCGPKAWQVFCALVHAKRKGEDVAREFDQTVDAVYMTKRRVKKMLKEELARLNASREGESEA